MNKLTLAFVAALSLTTFGCKKKGGGSDALAKMESLQKSMCDCKDKACADKVNSDMAAWGLEMAKTAVKADKPDPELEKKSADLMVKYTDCMMTAGGDKAKPPAPKPDSSGKCPDKFTYNAESKFCIKLPAGAVAADDGKGFKDDDKLQFNWGGGDAKSNYSILVKVRPVNEYYDDDVKDVKDPEFEGKAAADGKLGDRGAWGSGASGPPPAGVPQRHYMKSANRNDKMQLTCITTRAVGPETPSEDEVFEACKTIQFAN